MPTPNIDPQSSQINGIVHQVDLVNRELTALVEERLVKVYLPTACEVVLRGERIKLRMIQLGDRVRVSYSDRDDLLVASAIEVHNMHLPIVPS